MADVFDLWYISHPRAEAALGRFVLRLRRGFPASKQCISCNMRAARGARAAAEFRVHGESTLYLPWSSPLDPGVCGCVVLHDRGTEFVGEVQCLLSRVCHE